jgi:hypothetical protein
MTATQQQKEALGIAVGVILVALIIAAISLYFYYGDKGFYNDELAPHLIPLLSLFIAIGVGVLLGIVAGFCIPLSLQELKTVIKIIVICMFILIDIALAIIGIQKFNKFGIKEGDNIELIPFFAGVVCFGFLIGVGIGYYLQEGG